MLQETRFQVQVLKPCKFVQESSEEVLFIKSRQLAQQLVSIEVQESYFNLRLDSCSTDRVSVETYEVLFFRAAFIQSVNVYLGFLFSQP